jgi:hypothetical protein
VYHPLTQKAGIMGPEECSQRLGLPPVWFLHIVTLLTTLLTRELFSLYDFRSDYRENTSSSSSVSLLSLCVSLCIPLIISRQCLTKCTSVAMNRRNNRIVGHTVISVVHVILEESRQLVLPIIILSSCLCVGLPSSVHFFSLPHYKPHPFHLVI